MICVQIYVYNYIIYQQSAPERLLISYFHCDLQYTFKILFVNKHSKIQIPFRNHWANVYLLHQINIKTYNTILSHCLQLQIILSFPSDLVFSFKFFLAKLSPTIYIHVLSNMNVFNNVSFQDFIPKFAYSLKRYFL